MHSKGVRRGGELKNRLDKTATQSVAYVYLIAGWISGGDLKGSQAVSVGNCGMVHGGRMGYHCVGGQHLPLG